GLRRGCGDRNSARRKPGAEPITLLLDDSPRPRSRVFQPLRGELGWDKLARPAPLWPGAPTYRELSHRYRLARVVLRTRPRPACPGERAPGSCRRGEFGAVPTLGARE